MSIVADGIARILRVLQDENQTNYQDTELCQYYGQAIGYLSRELARWGSRIGIDSVTLSYASGEYSKTLPADFLALATNNEGKPRVFNASNSADRLTRAEVSDLDDWESEDSDDDGTVEEFIIDGTSLVVHPRPETATDVTLYYHPLKSITDDSSTMPWNSWFDDPIEQFVLRQCRLRSEMIGMFQIDVADYERLSQQCRDLLLLRENNWPTLRPHSGSGWMS